MELRKKLVNLIILPIFIIFIFLSILGKNFFQNYNNLLISDKNFSQMNYFQYYLKNYFNSKNIIIDIRNGSIEDKNKIFQTLPPSFIKKEIFKIKELLLDDNFSDKALYLKLSNISNKLINNLKFSINYSDNQHLNTNFKLYFNNLYILHNFSNIQYILKHKKYSDDNSLDFYFLNSIFNLKNLTHLEKKFHYKNNIDLDFYLQEYKNIFEKKIDYKNFNEINEEIFKLIINENIELYNNIKKYLKNEIHNVELIGFIFFFITVIFLILSLNLYNYISNKIVIDTEISEQRKDIINSEIIYVETDLNGIITYVSEYFCKISGYDFNNLIGKNYKELIHPSTKNFLYIKIWNTISKGKKWTGILKQLKNNNSSFYLKTTIFPIFKNKIHIGYGSSSEDITQIIINDNKSSNIYASLNTIVITTDGENLKEVNNKFFDYFNYNSLEDFKKEHKCICELFISEDNKNYLTETYKGLRWSEYLLKNKNKEELLKVCMIDKYQNKRVFRVKLINNIENITDYIVLFNDITKIENQSDLLLQQAKFSTMGEMTAMIAHQWRQPLSSLNSLFLPILMKKQLGENISYEDMEDKVKKQNEVITYLSDTIDDFLSFTKIDDNLEEQTIEETINKPFRLIENSLKHIKLDFKVDYINCEKNKIIKLKHTRFNQVLLNLYKNSLDEFNKKPEITSPQLKIEIREEEKYFEYLVSDNAGGISEDIIDRIFLPYFSTKSKNGTGIGLYMTKMIIENHLNGKIKVYNNDNNGLSFLIFIEKQ